MKNFAVIGNPVSHSLSPIIHQQFANQFDIDLQYVKIHADEGEFQSKIDEFKSQGGCGLNVTVPYKSQAFEISDQLSEQAKLARAVNTLSFRDNFIYGENTDGTGLVNDLVQNHKYEISGKSILIIGAGGAVSGVLAPLLAQHPAQIIIANRTVEKATDLASRFSHLGNIQGCGLDQIEQLEFGLVINGTAASLGGKVPKISIDLLQNVLLAYDMMYSKEPTVFMRWAQDNGAKSTIDGLGMLVEQAATAFEVWHDVKPDTSTVLINLRA